MRIESKGVYQTMSLHNDKAGTVCEREPFIVIALEHEPSVPPKIIVYLYDLDAAIRLDPISKYNGESVIHTG